MHYIDIGILILYFSTLFTIGLLKPHTQTGESYMNMGRRLTLFPFIMTLVSTWYGGILGVSEFSYSYGLSNWIIFGLPYYVFGIAFAFLVAKRAHEMKLSSLPEILGREYGSTSSLLASMWVLLLASPAPYVLTLGILLQYFLGWNLLLSITLGGLFSLFYVFRGGFLAVIKTDQLQFSFMFLGFAVLLFNLMGQVNPIDLVTTLPESHTSITGGHSFGYILVWFFIGSWTLVDPGFHQRVYATRNGDIAKRGILGAVCFWFLFDLMTTLTGLYAYSLLPAGSSPSQAFLILGSDVLPVGIRGLFFTGILATVMSTLDSGLFVSGISLGRDIPDHFKRFASIDLTKRIKVAMLVTVLIAILLAWRMPSVVDLWYTFGTIAIPALLLPTLAGILKWPIGKPAIVLNLWLPPLLSLGWFLFAKLDEWNYVWGLEPFYPGLFASMLIMGLHYFMNKDEFEHDVS